MKDNLLLTIADYEQRSRENLPRSLFDLIFGEYGAKAHETNTNNLDGLARLKLRPRVLAGVTTKLATSVLGVPIDFPVLIAPAGLQDRYHPEAELACARAAGRLGTILTVSTLSSFSIEEVAAVATRPLWFQLYFLKDVELNKILVTRAQQAGYQAIMVTVDTVTTGSRERDRLSTDERIRSLKNLVGIGRPDLPTVESFPEALKSDLTWSDVEWLQTITSLPIIVKGIQTAEDAKLCYKSGFAAMVVSNHGGHAASGARATIDALPEIVEAVGDKVEVYLDGGIRKGADVLKALALGARAVLIGRPAMWGLAAGGQEGVEGVLEILRHELHIVVSHCGVKDITAVDKRVVDRTTVDAESTSRLR